MTNKGLVLVCFLHLVLTACKQQPVKTSSVKTPPKKRIEFTAYSNAKNEYINFNSVKAINKIAVIENEYFNNYTDSISKYYGTVWREQAENTLLKNNRTLYEEYIKSLPKTIKKPDSMHCTIYAFEGLKAGLDSLQLSKLKKLHKDIWKTREVAGWSIGYLLVKHFNWQAYLILDPNSKEYSHCIKAFQKNKSYPVWKQPDIPLEQLFIKGKHDSLINNLLKKHEFGWGFSEQGIHTWITRFNILKECYWLGAPALQFQEEKLAKPLFLKTAFKNYLDYNSHVVIFPRKKNKIAKSP